MFSLITIVPTLLIGILSGLILKQYRRVQKRDIGRRRVQSYQSKNTSNASDYDPLDHSLYWYPVALSREVVCGAKNPLGVHLLNEPLCLYRRNDGQIVCVLDLCPHRSAPLSIGQMTKDGNLECVYHGWQYGANGQCVYIPSVFKTSNTAAVICARTKPVHEQYGYIWVWPGKQELANSDRIPHQLFADVQNGTDDYILSPEEVCDLDMPYDLMVDNLLDMAHIDFTHDGTIGKRSAACPILSEAINPSLYASISKEAATYKITRKPLKTTTTDFSEMSFIPPCFVRLNHHQGNGTRLFIQIFMIIPSQDQKLRLFMQFYRNFARLKFIEYIPGYDYLVWKNVNKIVQQDVLLLDGINRNVSSMGAKVLATTVVADAPIRAFRRYYKRALNKFGTIYFEKMLWASHKTNNTADNTDMDIEDLTT